MDLELRLISEESNYLSNFLMLYINSGELNNLLHQIISSIELKCEVLHEGKSFFDSQG